MHWLHYHKNPSTLSRRSEDKENYKGDEKFTGTSYYFLDGKEKKSHGAIISFSCVGNFIPRCF